ncbi:MAG TPA: hypothetical protein VIK74_10340, partial [Parasegetibacter sp.]
GFPRVGKDQAGNPVNFYSFDLTRYVQSIVTQKATNFGLRLMAPTQLVHERSAFNYLWNYQAYFLGYQIFSFNPPARGRVQLGGGSHPTNKMRLRIIYSKI